MPTAASWGEPALHPVRDLVALLRFRAATSRRPPRRTAVAATWVLALTAAVAVAPAFLAGAGDSDRAQEVGVVLPTALAGFLVVAVVSAGASGGGRQLLPGDQAAPHPVSPTVDHLGALVLAPLNIAWLLQAWALLGSTAYVVGPGGLPTALPVVLLWLPAATALAQAVSWAVESVRRRRHGVGAVRLAGLVVVGAVVGLQSTGRLVPILDHLPTVWLVVGAVQDPGWRWLATLAVEVVLLVVAVVVGAWPAGVAARRAPRDELRLESRARDPLPAPRTDLLGLVRTDRASVWRTVPVRRGIAVLALGPGLVALAGELQWSTMTLLPGLVASGGALLFGVNAWALDGRGTLWRESLPVQPGRVFTARSVVLAEFLLLGSAATLLMAALRAGAPSAGELAGVLCAWLVVTGQVVSAAMRWSHQRPYAVDLRSARATPAPPAVMVGYSARLAVTTTLTALVFSGLTRLPAWELSVLAAAPFLAWSWARLLRSRVAWQDPGRRSAVVAVVAA